MFHMQCNMAFKSALSQCQQLVTNSSQHEFHNVGLESAKLL